jgi:autotransporter passenger strand-loop-strand repeat protein
MNTGNVYILDNAAARNMAQTNGRTYISGGATAYSMNMGGGFNYVAAGATLVNYTATGGNTYFSDSDDTPFLVGSDTNINTKRLRYYPNSNTGLSVRVTNGVVYDLGTDGNLFRLGVGDDILVSGGSVGNDCRLSAFGTAVLRGVKVTATTADAGAVLTDTAKSYDVELNGSGKAATLTVGGNATAFATVVNSGGELKINAGGTDVGAIVGGSGGLVNVSAGGVASATRALTNGRINLNAGAAARNISISGGVVYGYNGCTVTDTELVTGGTLRIYAGATVSGVTMAAGNIQLLDNAVATGITQTAGKSYISGGAVASSMNMGGGFNYVAAGATLVNYTATGGNTYFNDSDDTPFLVGRDTNINANRLRYTSDATTALGLSVVNGEVRNLGKDGKEFRLGVGSGIVVKDAVLGGNQRLRLFDGAVASNASVVAGTSAGVRGTLFASGTAEIRGAVASGALTTNRALINLYDSAVAYDIVVDNCGTLAPLADGVKAYNTLVKSGGYLVFSAGDKGRGAIENTTILAGGTMTLNEYADTGDLLTLDFTGANGGTVNINDLSLINSKTKVVATGVETVGTYTLGSGSRDSVTQAWGLYENALVNGGTYDDALNGVTYSFDGTALTTTELTIATGAAAGLAGDDYTALRGTDRAAKWTSGAGTTLVTENFSGDAWVEVSGNLTGALYGAAVDFANTVNINATSGTIRNLAAGAETGKTVGAVKLTFDGADLAGAGYAGGFGNVTNETETLITTGSFAKDFYAGALANKLTSATSVGDVSMTIDGGTFSGNIYGASAVKTVAGKNGTRHTAGDVTLTITDGETTKGTQSCIFAGGYATGDATGTVYTVDSVTATISGGSWGEAAGGRGVFGGIMASGVEAQVIGDVNITISGDATMGNVYGGGWAQKENAKSIVGDVNINIAGGTIANVFGGGTHSSSGGTTEAGEVTITVSGGDITGAIYARGQLEGDTTGSASVIFTGATDFGCDVFGYSYVGGAASDAVLSYTAYTGTFSGKIGGFDGIVFDDDTAMTLSTAAADILNGKWEFDFTDRADTFSATSLLTWSTADFAGDTVKVTFADATQAAAGWSIADAAFTGATFDLYIGGDKIAEGIAYNTVISGGDWDGWKFTDENGTLKFAQITA